jgi:hypothetical protein
MNAPNAEAEFAWRNGSAMLLTCEICRRPYVSRGAATRCPTCGGVLAAKPKKNRARRAAPFLAVGLLVAGAMSAVAAREKIVRLAPAAARAYAAIGLPVNLRGVAFNDLRTSLIEADGRQVLTVEGALVNLRDQKAEIADMRIALRDADAHEIYVWTTHPPKTALEPREQTPFRLRLASPPPGAHDVVVRFAAASDKATPTEDKL